MGFGESGFLINSAVLNFWMFASVKKDLVNPDLLEIEGSGNEHEKINAGKIVPD